MAIKVKSARWLDDEHTAADTVITVDGADYPYTVTAAEAAAGDPTAIEVWEALAEIPVQPPLPYDPAGDIAAARRTRNQYLADSDIFMLPDYPISAEDRLTAIAYRKYLRGLPDTSDDWYTRHILTWEEYKAAAGEDEA